MKKTLKFFLLPLIAMIAIFVACNKDNAADVDEAVDEALYSLQERGGMGRFGCYELVFPLSITLPDGTAVEIDSNEELVSAVRRYFSSHGRPRQHRQLFQFVFPISVISQDGDLITIDDQEGLFRLRADCAGTFGNHGPQGHGNHGLSCFTLVFPITIEFPDGTTAEAADRMALRQLIRDWRQNNPGSQERPKIVFPITVKMTADGSLVTVNSREELRQLKEDCE
jgi:hypothetical protein